MTACVFASDFLYYRSISPYLSIGHHAIILWVIDMSRLKELRKARGITQVQMQMLTGIDQSDYSKIESGKRYYTFEQCKRIARALDTSMDYLAGLTDVQEPYPRARQGS